MIVLAVTRSQLETALAMTSRKLFGKDLNEFEDVDVDDLLTQLSAEELEILSKEVDPDVRKHGFVQFYRPAVT